MVGMSEFIYTLGWLIPSLVQLLLSCLLITIATSSTVFEYSNKLLVFFFFAFFSIASISLCFLLATCFSRAKVASLLGPVIFFASFFPFYAVNDAQFSTQAKTATCLLAPACFALGATVFADYEGGLVGVQWSNIGQTTSNFSYRLCIAMLIADSILYAVLAWYVDKVIPKEHGVKLPWYFLFTPSYWRCQCNNSWQWGRTEASSGYTPLPTSIEVGDSSSGFDDESMHKIEADDPPSPIPPTTRYPLVSPLLVPVTSTASANANHASDDDDNSFIEELSSDMTQQIHDNKAVIIQHLHKVYPSTDGSVEKIAVHDLNLQLFEGMVNVLLGHNGAGKTTTIAMLTGMIPSSSGDIIFPGQLTIAKDLALIRKSGLLGICPQQDILFPELSPYQHLILYGQLKGVFRSQLHAEVMEMIQTVGLPPDKVNTPSGKLSGGQKRKLSLAIALIGNSKVIILDEPTSGLDPLSRRAVWEAIQRCKIGRILLLVLSHHLDDAEVLGDRISFMADGKLQCSGSGLFLKRKCGVGYNLTVSWTNSSHVVAADNSDYEVKQQIINAVQTLLPEAEATGNNQQESDTAATVSKEVVYRLPFTAAHRFPPLFTVLDSLEGELDYGVSVTTLEEVFLRLGREAGLQSDPQADDNAHDDGIDHHSDIADDDDDDDAEDAISPQVSLGNNNVGSDHPRFELLSANTQEHDLLPDEEQGLTTQSSTINKKVKKSSSRSFCFWWKLERQQLAALLFKRFHYGRRDRKLLLCQLLLPIGLVALGLALLLLRPGASQPSLLLSPQKLNDHMAAVDGNTVPFYYQPSSSLTSDTLAGEDKVSVCEQLLAQFNSAQYLTNHEGVYGNAFNITLDDLPTTDPFNSCSVGAMPLHNLSTFLVTNSDLHVAKGASLYGSIALDQCDIGNLTYAVLVNASGVHAAGIYPNLVHTAFLQSVTKSSSAYIKTRNHPLPVTYSETVESFSVSAFVAALFMAIAICFVPASFASYVVKEREIGFFLQQKLAGVSPFVYWLSNWLFDSCSFLPAAGIVCGIWCGVLCHVRWRNCCLVVVIMLWTSICIHGILAVISFFIAFTSDGGRHVYLFSIRIMSYGHIICPDIVREYC